MTQEQEMTMREALNLALDEALKADDRVFLLGEDIADPGASGPTAGLSTKYGHDRVLDTPISEAAIVGAAIGAAIDGMLPVAEIMIMDFIGIAADQLINNAAKLRFMTAGRTTAPITIRTQVYAGLATGATHSQSLEAWFMHIPGMKVIVPSTPRDLRRGPLPVHRNDSPARQEGTRPGRPRVLNPIGAGGYQATRHRRDADQLRAQRA
jgi:acetoin:2,6-dichlorophenolindophenol oxidoreductase subunit beta